jgi:hypothetical protein
MRRKEARIRQLLERLFAEGNGTLDYLGKSSILNPTDEVDCSDFPLETGIEPARRFWTTILNSFRHPKGSCHASLRSPLVVEAVAIPGQIHEDSNL